MKLCNARIDFKISLELLSWFIIIRKIAFWSVVALEIVDPIFSLFFWQRMSDCGVDLYGDGVYKTDPPINADIRSALFLEKIPLLIFVAKQEANVR